MSRFINLGKGIFRDVFGLKNAPPGLHSGIVVRNREISWFDANAAQPRLCLVFWPVLAAVWGQG